MPSADPRAGEIVRTITEFEASTEAAEAALLARDWERLDDLLSAQHRLTHALANLLEETADVRPPAFSEEVNRRIARISERRADQLRRLIAFNHLVKERLTMVSRARRMRSPGGDNRPPPRILNTMQ